MRVLIIWELIAERTEFFVINDPPAEHLLLFADAHGKYINYDEDCDGLEFVNKALSDPKYLLPGSEHASYYLNKVEVAYLPAAGPFDVVFHTGFAL